VTLDRQIIARRDFPIAKRGYDPAAVDAHLSALADAVDELQEARQPQPETLATAISEQVRGIVQAAEDSAAEILRNAEREAQEARAQASQATAQASGEARSMRERAAAQAREYVTRLSSSISQMLERLEALDGELNALTTSLRRDTERLRGELTALEDELEGITRPSSREAVERLEPVPAETLEPERRVTTPPEQRPGSRVEFTRHPVRQPEVVQPAAGPAKIGDQPPEQPPPAAREAAEDIEGARLIVLNMALNGTSREETRRYLAENYELADPEGLLDEVYSRVQG
jgi:DivIVA domain-containing protein